MTGAKVAPDKKYKLSFTIKDTYRGDGLNLYAYVGNNPVNYYDPSGYSTCGSKTNPYDSDLSSRGYKPKPGERSMTKEQWKQQYRNERIDARAARKTPSPGDANYTGQLPANSWRLTPRGQGAHVVERVNVEGRPNLAQFDTPQTPRFYPQGSPENAGQAHIRMHQATKQAGIDLQGGNPEMNDSQLLNLYERAYSNPSLDGIRGDLRTPNSSTVVNQNITPAQAFEELLKWGGL